MAHTVKINILKTVPYRYIATGQPDYIHKAAALILPNVAFTSMKTLTSLIFDSAHILNKNFDR